MALINLYDELMKDLGRIDATLILDLLRRAEKEIGEFQRAKAMMFLHDAIIIIRNCTSSPDLGEETKRALSNQENMIDD